jgi:arginine/lysine/ornithine decarboxylase
MQYSSSKLSFHMPGHKFGTSADIDKINLSLLDNTEVIGMDNLYDAKGIIKQAMGLMADFYGAKETLFLTNGSTAGILASILAVCKDNDKIIVARNCHHSVWNALALSGAEPIYVSPKYLQEDHILGGITAEDIKEALVTYPDVKGVIIVSPTYEGIVSDIKEIAQVVHAHEKILIVDEAHGAHFIIGDKFPISSIQLGADIVINSMHKTLPALTQSALCHICSDRVDYKKVLSALRMIQTSSPSYIIMGLMDYIRCYILDHKQIIKEEYINYLICTRESLKRLKRLKLIEKPSAKYDISKILISTMHTNIDGYRLAEMLDDQYDIVVEAALSTHIIVITTMADNKDTLSALEDALIAIDCNLEYKNYDNQLDYVINHEITEGRNPRQVYHAEKEWLPINRCEGKIAANAIILYPPGIPVICIGERLKNEYIQLIYELKEKLQGIRLLEASILIEVVKED